MKDFMLDLETLSTLPTARILAIGAVVFDEKKVHDRFYQAILAPSVDTLKSMELAFTDFTDVDGFHISKDTLRWWDEQSDQAKEVFHDESACTIKNALVNFSTWVQMICPADEVRMWGNGASFDNVILKEAYRICAIEPPWKFYNDRCYRTWKNITGAPPATRLGTYHNAVNDAETQAVHMIHSEATLA